MIDVRELIILPWKAQTHHLSSFTSKPKLIMRQDRTEIQVTHRKYLVLALLSVSGGTLCRDGV